MAADSPPMLAPMLATLGDLPTAEGAWAYEFKWDGIRAVSSWDGDGLVIRSRNGRDITGSWPELAGLGTELGACGAVLDGEIVAFDDDERSSFSLLQQRMHVADGSRARLLAQSVPAVYLVFDVLWLDGTLATQLPWAERRRLLDDLDLAGPSWRVPAAFLGDGAAVLDVVHQRGLEGVVAKRVTSTYQPGRRSGDWVKTKVVDSDEFIVVGWLPGEGRRAGGIGSLLLAGWQDDGPGGRRLRHVGAVGSGFSDAELDRLEQALKDAEVHLSPLESGPQPRRGARWVTPRLVVEVAFRGWTPGGVLRQPTYRGQRDDKPSDAVWVPAGLG